jgi:aspartyl-tRNA(Asn)/glutamyl-tRNA(Gln) amidotransferase subunit C
VKFTREEIMQVSRLAKMGVNEAEVETFARQLSDILENFEILKTVDTEGVPPTTQPIPLDNLLKADLKKPSISQDDALANAPNREGEFFRTRAVLE